MTPHRIWTAIGVVGAITGLFDLFRRSEPFTDSQPEPSPEPDPQPEPEGSNVEPEPTETSETIRARVVAWAESQEGASDPTPYWRDALDGAPPPYPKSWCGAFVLAALHHAGLALDRHWAIGRGLEATLPLLERTDAPLPGDVAYFTANQHMAVVIEQRGDYVALVNGNGVGGRVVIDERPVKNVKQFYSIRRYVDARLGGSNVA